ncbi:hypothetical protein [Haloarchaeobius sp. FL176]|uniref:hypothetical protein n=1 Tax=Haloarchaeobius sp. FL176 TaxID=2967129 RepID=UPI0021490BB9|nr:hypothetical protein [Haloarchaeobius sp. FL176]
MAVDNADTESPVVALVLLRDGSVVAGVRRTVERKENEVLGNYYVDSGWKATRGVYTDAVQVDDHDWHQRTLDPGPGVEVPRVTVRIDEQADPVVTTVPESRT